MKRNTLAKQIAAETDSELAVEIAQYGRRLSTIERATADYLMWRVGFDDIAARTKAALTEIIFRAIDCAEPKLRRQTPAERARFRGLTQAEIKLKQVTAREEAVAAANTLRELADFVQNCKDPHNPLDPADTKSVNLVSLRQTYEESGGKLPPDNLRTASSIAKMLRLQKTDDGNAALRRLCKKLNLPLAKAVKTGKGQKSSSKS